MEIKLNLRLQTILNAIHFVENMEQETLVLLLVGLLLAPLVILSLWSLSLAVLYQLFWLGAKAGVLLFFVCFCYLGFLTVFKKRPLGSPLPKCTLADIVLSVLFQARLWIPLPIWNAVVGFSQLCNEANASSDRKERPSRNRRYPDRKKPENEEKIRQEVPLTSGVNDGNVKVSDARDNDSASEFGVGGDYEVVDAAETEDIKNITAPTSFDFSFQSPTTTPTCSTAAGGPASRTRRRGRKHSSKSK